MENRISRRPAQGAVSALLCVLAALFCTCALAAGPTKRFDIAAGNALTTLDEFASQSSLYILYVTDAVKEIETNAVSGDLSVDDAVKQLLAGTRLSAHFESDYSLVSIKVSEVPQAAGSAVPPPNTSAAGDGNRGLAAQPARALASEPKLEEVVVTGTLMHGVVDIVSPLTFITQSDMKKTAYATVQDALQALSVNQAAIPGEIFTGNGNLARGVAANLRGLGSGATLVLVDGQRQPYSGLFGDFVDLSIIPANVVERIEVLPDGASALYGSDAVAGVVNIITRKDVNHAETQLRLGSALGAADEKLFSQLLGTHWASGNVLFAYQYSERGSLAAGDRAYTANADKRPLGGTDHRTIQSSPGNILDPSTFAPAFAVPSGQNGVGLSLSDLVQGQINLNNPVESIDVLAAKKMHNVLLNATQQLGDDVQLFGEARYATRRVSQAYFDLGQLLMVPANNPFAVNPYPSLPFMLVSYDMSRDLGQSFVVADISNIGGTLSTKINLSDAWRLTLSGTYGRESQRAASFNQINPVALNAALAETDPSKAFNAFGDGGDNNSAVIDTIRTTYFDRAISVMGSTSIVADGPVLELPSGPMKLGVGAEWRKESFERGDFTHFFSRTVQSAYAELSVPIIGDADDARKAPRLELSLAGRLERYSDFGSTANPKLGLRWAPSQQIKFRTTWGASFRAPKLVDIYDTSMDAAGIVTLPDPQSPSGSSVALIRTGSNSELHEERATTWTAGIDLAPNFLEQTTASLTYYVTEYKGRILVPGAEAPFEILVSENIWSDAITRNPSQAEIDKLCDSSNFYGSTSQCKTAPIAAIVDARQRNLGSTRVTGIDARLGRILGTRFGKFDFGIEGSYIFEFLQAASATSPKVDIVDTIGNPLALRARATIDWHQRDWNEAGFGVNLTWARVGSYENSEALDRQVNAFQSFDVRSSYRTPAAGGALSDMEFALNISNLFNSTPPFVDRIVGFDFVNAQPYGRVVSFSVQKNW